MAKTDSTEAVSNVIAATKASQALVGNKDPDPVRTLEQAASELEKQDKEQAAMRAKLPKK